MITIEQPFWGINWSRDTRVKAYPQIFLDQDVENSLGKFFEQNFGNHFHIRYPGGSFVQSFNLNPKEFLKDYYTPSPEIFFQFIKRNNLKVLHQLPTSNFISKGNGPEPIRKFGRFIPIDLELFDKLIDMAEKYCKWLQNENYWDFIIAFEIGNEDYSKVEGLFSPKEYVFFVEKYINMLTKIDDQVRIIVNTRPLVGDEDWGIKVLEKLKEKKLVNKIFGVATHIYPGWMVKELNNRNIDFHSYVFSNNSSFLKNPNYSLLTQKLDELNYPKECKIYVTECSIDLTLFNWVNNRKDLSAGLGLAKDIIELIGDSRFGGLSYFALFHQYLIESKNKQIDMDVKKTFVTDWGLGELWFFPESKKEKFVPTPLLKILGIISQCFNNNKKYGTLKISDNCNAILILNNEDEYVMVILNLNDSDEKIDLLTEAKINVINGGLNARSIPLGVTKITDGSLSSEAEDTSLTKGFTLPGYSLAYAKFNSAKLNGRKISEDIIGYRGF